MNIAMRMSIEGYLTNVLRRTNPTTIVILTTKARELTELLGRASTNNFTGAGRLQMKGNTFNVM